MALGSSVRQLFRNVKTRRLSRVKNESGNEAEVRRLELRYMSTAAVSCSCSSEKLSDAEETDRPWGLLTRTEVRWRRSLTRGDMRSSLLFLLDGSVRVHPYKHKTKTYDSSSIPLEFSMALLTASDQIRSCRSSSGSTEWTRSGGTGEIQDDFFEDFKGRFCEKGRALPTPLATLGLASHTGGFHSPGS
jgi:hypothetical protein